MLQLSYVGIALSLSFYVVFGVAVRLMELDNISRNRARLRILIISILIFTISSLTAGISEFLLNRYLLGSFYLIFTLTAIIVLLSILLEIHHIKRKNKIRRFMVLFNIVDKFISEGKSQEEILQYLTDIQQLTQKEATDFMSFISDPRNHQFLADVNATIQESRRLQ